MAPSRVGGAFSPYAFVIGEGEAMLSADLEETLPWSTRLGVGAKRGEEFGQRNAVEVVFLVRVRITKVVALDNVTTCAGLHRSPDRSRGHTVGIAARIIRRAQERGMLPSDCLTRDVSNAAAP
ncbi:hypothetical protein AB0D59_29700 [Streptomyces sp. NPDC048417]|uniref:hypothetical protein n=1 Tax=Streptomyces sp. NPDC048417 TaxID=3155387 RepID=UPI003422FCE3